MGQSNAFRVPAVIHYGENALQKLGDEAQAFGEKALVISDQIMQELGYVNQCEQLLHQQGIQTSIYLGVHSEPCEAFVHEALNLFHQDHCHFIVSVGGGSCIDTAKAVSILATNPGSVSEFIGAKRLAENEPVPHIAIPTTAGTGSEATDVTVINQSETDVKMMIKQPAFMPAVAIVDPLLTLSAPKHVTAATGIDALSHAIEAYLSKKSQPMTDTLAIAAMNNLIPAMKTVYDEPDNIEARGKMALGSLQAGMAFSNASVCLVHGMSRPIGALFHVPHGISNAMLLPAVLEYSQDACTERLAVIGAFFSDEPPGSLSTTDYAHLATRKIRELASYVNITNLKEWGIDEHAFFEAIPKMAKDALASGSPANNPKIPDETDIHQLYSLCYDYHFTK